MAEVIDKNLSDAIIKNLIVTDKADEHVIRYKDDKNSNYGSFSTKSNGTHPLNKELQRKVDDQKEDDEMKIATEGKEEYATC